jgi:uncharacterized protein
MGLIISVIAGLVAGLAIAFGILFALRRQWKAVRFQHGAASYVVPNSLNLTLSRDIFLYRKVTKSAIPKSNNSRR